MKYLESFGYKYNGSRDESGWDAVFSKNKELNDA